MYVRGGNSEKLRRWGSLSVVSSITKEKLAIIYTHVTVTQKVSSFESLWRLSLFYASQKEKIDNSDQSQKEYQNALLKNLLQERLSKFQRPKAQTHLWRPYVCLSQYKSPTLSSQIWTSPSASSSSCHHFSNSNTSKCKKSNHHVAAAVWRTFSNK